MSISSSTIPPSQSPPANSRSGGGQTRASMPPPVRVSSASPSGSSAFVNQPPPKEEDGEEYEDRSPTPTGKGKEIADGERATPEGRTSVADDDGEHVHLERTTSATSTESKRKSRSGTMNKSFRFPPESPSVSPVIPDAHPPRGTKAPPPELTGNAGGHGPGEEKEVAKPSVITPSSIEVPPPPPVEKERSGRSTLSDELDLDDVGDTEEISLN